MASKRKFTVAPLSDDEDEKKDGNIGGIATFKRYKAQSEPNKSKTITTSHNESISNDNIEPNLNQELQPSNKKPVDGPSSSTAGTNKIGKNFRETFAYLKNTDLFVLPPMPKPKEKPTPKNSNCIIVNSRQRGNPILKHIRNIPWEYGEIIPDYEIGQTSCALFLSMRYHSLNPEYVHDRLKKLGNMYDLRVLLVQVDVINSKPSLKELGRIAMYSSCTMILSWSAEEAGRYLETYKAYEHKPPDILQQRIEKDHLSKMQDLLTTVKSVNKTDVITLMSTFGSLRCIVNATKQEIGGCPGIGSQKASRLYSAFNQPFKRTNALSTEETEKTKNKPNKSNFTAVELPVSCQLKRPVDEKAKKKDKETCKKSNEEDFENKEKKSKEKQNLNEPVTEKISKSLAIQNFMKNKSAGLHITNATTTLKEKGILQENASLKKPITSLRDQLKNRINLTDATNKDVARKSMYDKSLTNNETKLHSQTLAEQQQITDAEFNDLVASDDSSNEG